MTAVDDRLTVSDGHRPADDSAIHVRTLDLDDEGPHFKPPGGICRLDGFELPHRRAFPSVTLIVASTGPAERGRVRPKRAPGTCRVASRGPRRLGRARGGTP